MGQKPLTLRFLTSAPDVDRLPDSPAEVAFAGRSNVGKSSLINALANRRQLAEVSKTPGRTRLLNLFEVTGAPGGRAPTVVDLPGYGFAKVPAAVKATWAPMIEGYLLERSPLRQVLVLVDGLVGPTELDIRMLEWTSHHGVPHQVVATKADKVKPSAQQRRRRDLAGACGLDAGDVLWVSAAKGDNVAELRSRVRGWLGMG